MTRLPKYVAAVVVATLCVVALHLEPSTAQDDLVVITGRVLWIAGATMVVAPYASGAEPVKVDLSQASLDEYMTLTAGASVTVAGTIPIQGDRIIAIRIRERARG